MNRNNGWPQWRRGVYEHVADRRMTIPENWLFGLIVAYADPATGLWEGSAEEISNRFPLSDRTVRDQLANLERKGYIKRFQSRGKNGPYPIIVNKFECTAGAMSGMRLNAVKSTSPKRLIYESAGTSAAASAGTSADHLIENIKEKRENARGRAGLPPTPLPRHSPGPQRPHDGSTVAPPMTPEQEQKVVAYFEQQQAKKKASVSVKPDAQRSGSVP